MSQKAKQRKEEERKKKEMLKVESNLRTKAKRHKNRQIKKYNAQLTAGPPTDLEKNEGTGKYKLQEICLTATKAVWARPDNHIEVRICLMTEYQLCFVI